MTREGYLKHKTVIEAWANGAKLEYKRSSGGHWQPLNIRDPYFREDVEYRAKPKPLEKWVLFWSSGIFYNWYDSYESAENARKFVDANNRGMQIRHFKEVLGD